MQAVVQAESRSRIVVEVDVSLPTISYNTHAGTIILSGNKVVLDGHFSKKDVEEFQYEFTTALKKWLPLSLAEPIVTSVRKQRLINMVKRAYLNHGKIFEPILEKCGFEADPDERVVIIDASKLSSKEIGHLIGKKGSKILKIEEELGIHLEITEGD